MKILFVNRYAGTYGGVEVYVRRMALALAGRGIECHLGFVEDRGDSTSAYLEAFSGWFRAADEESLSAEALGRKYDAVFLHKVDRVAPFLPLAAGTRLVRYIHDHDIVCPRRHKYYAFNSAICDRAAGLFCFLDAGFVAKRGRSLTLGSPFRFFSERAANRKVPLILVGSSYMRQELLANGFDPARVAILAPVPPESPATQAASAATPGAANPGAANPVKGELPGRYILYVGQLIRGKGVDLLIRAFAILAPRYPDLSLEVTGAGNAEAVLRSLSASLGLGDRVRFGGSVSSSRIDSLYAGAECLVVPSRWPEPFGMIGLEAMRKSIPVVGFASGGIPDWLHDGINGFLVPSGDLHGLAEAIGKLLDDRPLARRMGEAGHHLAASDFDFESSLDELVRHLDPVRGRKGGGDSGSGGMS